MEEPGMAISESAESKARVLTSIRLMVRLSEQYLRSQRKRDEVQSQSSGCAAEWTGDDSYFLRGRVGGATATALQQSPTRSDPSPSKRLRRTHQDSPSECQAMNILPDEILLAIFASVHSARDRSSCASACRRWLMLLTQMHRYDFLQLKHRRSEDSSPDDSVNQAGMRSGDEEEVLKLEKQPLWAIGDLTRCLENSRATDLRLASIAVGTAAWGGLVKLTIRGGAGGVSDVGLTAIGNWCSALRFLTLWDCPGIGDKSLKSIGDGCRLLESLELLKCPNLSDAGLRAVARSCLRLSNFSLESCDRVTDEGIASLAESCSNLLTLSLIRCTGVGDPAIVAVVKNCPTLKKLKLERVGVSDQGLAFLVQNCKSLTKLVLSVLDGVTTGGFLTLASPETLKFLKVLVLNGCPGVTDDFLSGFGAVCHDLYRLSLVDLEGVSDKGLESFVGGYQSLKALQIEKCGGVTYGGVASMLRSSSLKSLHISRCPGVRDSALELDPAPFVCSSLKSFSMAYSGGVGDRCLEFAGRIFPSIQHLDLSGTSELTDSGLKAFLACNGGSLLSLNLTECCQVSDDGIVEVGKKCWELQTLVMEGCYRVTDKSVGFVASQCRGLQELDVARCSITDDGIIAVVVSVGPALKTLSVAGCDRITDESLPTIQKMCDSLTALNLKNCRLSPGAVEKFESELGNRCDIVLP